MITNICAIILAGVALFFSIVSMFEHGERRKESLLYAIFYTLFAIFVLTPMRS